MTPVDGHDAPKRTYRMTARATTAQATGESILDAAKSAFEHLPFDRVTLKDIAAESGVTVQTVIRRFGSKEQLFEAFARREGARITTTRAVPEGTDLETALNVLLDHYEQDGGVIMHLISQEDHSDEVRRVVHEGRRAHREWVGRHCGGVLAGTRGPERELQIHGAIAATDLSTWNLLRRDLGLETEQVATIMIKLLNGMEKS